jgi:hypothetical protein
LISKPNGAATNHLLCFIENVNIKPAALAKIRPPTSASEANLFFVAEFAIPTDQLRHRSKSGCREFPWPSGISSASRREIHPIISGVFVQE